MASMPSELRLTVLLVPSISWMDALKLRLAGPALRQVLIDRLRLDVGHPEDDDARSF